MASRFGLGLDGTPDEVELVFRDQQDGKRVAFLQSKCVILTREDKARVVAGETWRVRLEDHGTYYIAFALSKVAGATPAPKPAAASGVATTVPTTTPPRPSPATAAAKAAAPATVAPAAKADTGRGPLKLQGMLLEPVNVIRETDRVAFFVDGANTDYACAELGFFLDWEKTLGYFLADGTFSGAYYFAAEYLEDDEQTRFLDALSFSGFTVRSKRMKVVRDQATGLERIKGNVDIELALEMVAAEAKFDVAYLFSGDSDFTRVLEILQSRGKRVFVVSTRRNLSRELGYAADKPTWFIEDFENVIGQHRGH